jgi:hypothetical protein
MLAAGLQEELRVQVGKRSAAWDLTRHYTASLSVVTLEQAELGERLQKFL